MERILLQVRALHRLEPASNDHLAAARVALSVAVPSLLLLAAGRPDLIIYAVFGALTGMYGRSEPHQLRLRHQGQAAVVILPVPWSLAGLVPGGQAVVLALLVVLFQFTTELFMTRHYGLAMVSFTPVILLMSQLADPIDPTVLILERGVETLVGALVGIAVVVAVRRAGTRTLAALLGRTRILRLPRRPRH